MSARAGLTLDLGIFKITLTSAGGVRVGAKIGDTYVSHKIKKPNKSKKVALAEA